MVVWFSVILEKQVLIAVQMSKENGLFKETIIPKNNTDVTWAKMMDVDLYWLVQYNDIK
jgi:hypothetical protein